MILFSDIHLLTYYDIVEAKPTMPDQSLTRKKNQTYIFMEGNFVNTLVKVENVKFKHRARARPFLMALLSTGLENSHLLHYGKKDSKIGKILGNLYQITTVSKFMFLGMF